jgi:peroxin-5
MYLKNYMTHHPQYAGLELTDIYGTGETETAFDQAQSMLLRADQGNAKVQEALGVVYNVSRDYSAAASAFRRALFRQALLELSANCTILQ